MRHVWSIKADYFPYSGQNVLKVIWFDLMDWGKNLFLLICKLVGYNTAYSQWQWKSFIKCCAFNIYSLIGLQYWASRGIVQESCVCLYIFTVCAECINYWTAQMIDIFHTPCMYSSKKCKGLERSRWHT